MWDRAFGGSTIILHIDGTTAPNTMLTPDRMRAHVHLPPHFVEENPGSHLAIAHIVQLFIEYVGLPTVERWTRSAHTNGWSLSFTGNPAPPHPPAHRLIPIPATATSHYVFWGRPWSSLSPLATSQSILAPPVPSTPVTELNNQLSDMRIELAAAQGLARERLGIIVDYEERHDHLLEREQEVLQQVVELQDRIQRLKQKSKAVAMSTTPAPLIAPSSLRSPPSTPTRKPAKSVNPTSPSRTHMVGSPSLVTRVSQLSVASSFPSVRPLAETPRQRGATVGPTAAAYIRDNCLEYLLISLDIMVRQVSPVRYYEEVERLGLDEDISNGLLSALSADT
ncbi:hypothetical protein C8J57DRAFT_1500415 [Mycena rebaudengoi]|nr:hypothetical protein C8J57DRAFT_1500415 [Mycena rebaudengoi]